MMSAFAHNKNSDWYVKSTPFELDSYQYFIGDAQVRLHRLTKWARYLGKKNHQDATFNNQPLFFKYCTAQVGNSSISSSFDNGHKIGVYQRGGFVIFCLMLTRQCIRKYGLFIHIS